ncbi:MAG: sigma-54-dependent Fis family transcriptional regulator [Marinilabiliaceae bacterium]|nr:sigma-54-dependent Fis family transcriptional regulator [Marinilabiliaceae bacterium]
MIVKQGSILAVDDNEDILFALKLLLKPQVESFHTATTPCQVPKLMKTHRFDVILLDMSFRDKSGEDPEGFKVLKHIFSFDPQAKVIFITGHGDVEKSVQAIKAGAIDFVTKPWQNERLIEKVKQAIQLPTNGITRPVPAKNHSPKTTCRLVYRSACMRKVAEDIRKVAGTDANVLILGENGTGKQLVAEAIHDHSKRCDQPFVSVDLGSLSESLFENELFGHAKGAYTDAKTDQPGRIETASGGTLFLDEIGNLSPHFQTKLLTVLERREVTRLGESISRPVDIRLISATNRPITEMIQNGQFREDLLYRINTVEITIPPLRERTEDIPVLLDFFLRQYSKLYQKIRRRADKPAVKYLTRYSWPGNVRELQHVVERAVILSDNEILSRDDLYPENNPLQQETISTDSHNLDTIERKVINQAMQKHSGNITQAAIDLGITRTALYRRMKKFGLND